MCQMCQQKSTNLGQRFFAWSSSKSDNIQDKAYGRIKHQLFKNLSGKVLEIGPGTGINFDYFPNYIHWIGIEPSAAMQKYLKKKISEKGIKGKLLSGGAETIPLPDESVNHVVCTLVLCSVSSQESAIREVRRVLKPGGSFLFIEHVGSTQGSISRRVQEWARPVWNVLADGCDPARDTANALVAADFSQLEYQQFDQKGLFGLSIPHISGVAIK